MIFKHVVARLNDLIMLEYGKGSFADWLSPSRNNVTVSTSEAILFSSTEIDGLEYIPIISYIFMKKFDSWTFTY